MKALILLSTFAVLLLSGCATSTSITSQSVPQFNPANYSTFAILEVPEAAQERTDPAIYRSVKMLMLGSLRSKGLTSTDLESADLVFQVMGNSLPSVDVANYGFFYASTYGFDWYPVSYRTTSFTNSAEGTAVVSAFDNKTKELVWQGYGRATSTSSTISVEQVMDGIKEIMSQYPAK